MHKLASQVFFQVTLIFGLCLSLLGGPRQGVRGQDGFAGGSGTAADPYLVATADHLNNVRYHLEAYFRQTASINLDVTPYHTGGGWVPIGYDGGGFSGHYDGRGFVVSGLVIRQQDALGAVGLFGVVQHGKIEKLGVVNVDITGKDYVGALAGKVMESSTIERCYSTGSLAGRFYTGGLVGRHAGTLIDSYSRAAVAADNFVAGLVGQNAGGIYHSYSTGLVGHTGSSPEVGGLVGENTGSVVNSYWDIETSLMESSAGGIGGTTAEMQEQATFLNWDFINTWTIDEGQSYPYHQALPQEPCAPAITSEPRVVFSAGEPNSFIVTGTGFPLPGFSLAGDLPAGVSFIDNQDGTAQLGGTPAEDNGGLYEVTITASNGVFPDATQAFTLTVNQVPLIISADQTSFTVGAAGSFTILTTGWPLPTLTHTGGTLPSGFSLTDNGDGTAHLSGTPGAGSGGRYPLMITASNGSPPDFTQTLTVTVNQAPAFTSADHAVVRVGETIQFVFSTTGHPPPYVTLVEGSLPAGVVFIPGESTASLWGTPAENTGGLYGLTITASNGVSLDATQAFMLTVSSEKMIDSGGGTIHSDDGAITIIVPVGAVADLTKFTLTHRASPGHSIGSLGYAGISFQLLAEDALGNPVTAFGRPLTVIIQYDPAALRGITEETLMLYSWDGTTWVDAACGPYGREMANQFTVEVCHLSEFAVLGALEGYQIFLGLILR
jgi:hypothetical protein